MSTYIRIVFQIVFGGKDFSSFISVENREHLFQYIFGVLRNLNCHPYIVGGHRNHIHIITSLHSSVCLADLVKEVKTSSHSFMDQRPVLFDKFKAWQVGYGAFSYDYSSLNNLMRYVKNQEKHHTKKTYEDEVRKLCLENNIEFDPKYFLI